MSRDPGFDAELDPSEIAALLGRADLRAEDLPLAPEATYLVTGAGGSIGQGLVLALARQGRDVLALDRAEAGLFLLGLRLREEALESSVRLVVRDAGHASVAELVGESEVDVVVHAAAHKHVGLMESEAFEVRRNNVTVTAQLLANASSVQRFVLVSTDKAVDPICEMGRSKREAERLVLAPTAAGPSRAVIRLPNVLGSAGSVAQVFRRALLRGDELVLRKACAERLYLGPVEARRAILAAIRAPESALFVPETPPAISTAELAARARVLWAPTAPLRLRDQGLGPGERASESLVGRSERARPGPRGLMIVENGDRCDDAPQSS